MNIAKTEWMSEKLHKRMKASSEQLSGQTPEKNIAGNLVKQFKIFHRIPETLAITPTTKFITKASVTTAIPFLIYFAAVIPSSLS
jgi:hypothetical protein